MGLQTGDSPTFTGLTLSGDIEVQGGDINLTNGDVTGNTSSQKSGVSARVFKDGNWGFSSNPEINTNSIYF